MIKKRDFGHELLAFKITKKTEKVPNITRFFYSYWRLKCLRLNPASLLIMSQDVLDSEKNPAYKSSFFFNNNKVIKYLYIKKNGFYNKFTPQILAPSNLINIFSLPQQQTNPAINATYAINISMPAIGFIISLPGFLPWPVHISGNGAK